MVYQFGKKSLWDVNVQYIFCFGFHTPFYIVLCYFSFSHNLLFHLLCFLIILYVM